MLKLQPLSDKTAIGLSLLCTLHCLALPILLIAFPNVLSLQLNNEAFHFWMILAVIPISIFALTLGCKQHKRFQLLIIGAIGLLLLFMAIILPESLLGEQGEKILTLIGAGLIAIGHFKNFKLCQPTKECACSNS